MHNNLGENLIFLLLFENVLGKMNMYLLPVLLFLTMRGDFYV